MPVKLAAIALALPLILGGSAARAQDIDLCFTVADRVAEGEAVSEADKRLGHEACQRALAFAETSNPRGRFRHPEHASQEQRVGYTIH